MTTTSFWGTKTLLKNATATGAGNPVRLGVSNSVYQGTASTSSGTGSVTYNIEVSTTDGSDAVWVVAIQRTISLTTTATSVGDHIIVSWPYVRANITSISGTGAALTVRSGG